MIMLKNLTNVTGCNVRIGWKLRIVCSESERQTVCNWSVNWMKQWSHCDSHRRKLSSCQESPNWDRFLELLESKLGNSKIDRQVPNHQFLNYPFDPVVAHEILGNGLTVKWVMVIGEWFTNHHHNSFHHHWWSSTFILPFHAQIEIWH